MGEWIERTTCARGRYASKKARGVDRRHEDLTPWPPLDIGASFNSAQGRMSARHNSYPCHFLAAALEVAVQRATTYNGTKSRVAGTYKRLSPAKCSARKVWVPHSGLPVLTWSSHAMRKNKSAKKRSIFSMLLSAFPLICLEAKGPHLECRRRLTRVRLYTVSTCIKHVA